MTHSLADTIAHSVTALEGLQVLLDANNRVAPDEFMLLGKIQKALMIATDRELQPPPESENIPTGLETTDPRLMINSARVALAGCTNPHKYDSQARALRQTIHLLHAAWQQLHPDRLN